MVEKAPVVEKVPAVEKAPVVEEAPVVVQDSLAVKTQEDAPVVEAPYPGYFDIHSMHQETDYSQPAPETLPGADFNKQVWEFDQSKNIWDQQDYNERVKAEAEILVALEALKTAVLYLGSDISATTEFLRTQYLGEDADVTK